MNLSQLACIWVAQKSWSHCSHSLWDSHVAHIEHGHSPRRLLLSILRVLGAPESLGREGKGQSEKTALERGKEPDPCRDPPGVRKGTFLRARRHSALPTLCWPSQHSPREGLVGSSEYTKARAGLLLGAELGSSVAQGGAELLARAQMSDSGSQLSSLRFTLLLPWKRRANCLEKLWLFSLASFWCPL